METTTRFETNGTAEPIRARKAKLTTAAVAKSRKAPRPKLVSAAGMSRARTGITLAMGSGIRVSPKDSSPRCLMLHYPKIPGSRHCPDGRCVAFEKYDGTNLHWEWEREFGWHSFGTRRDGFTLTKIVPRQVRRE